MTLATMSPRRSFAGQAAWSRGSLAQTPRDVAASGVAPPVAMGQQARCVRQAALAGGQAQPSALQLAAILRQAAGHRPGAI
jgi:hypothetical protein